VDERAAAPVGSAQAGNAGEPFILDFVTSSLYRRRPALSLQQASEESPQLASLIARARDSQARLAAIAPLLPAGLRDALQAGPVEEASWCLLVKNSAAAAKLRQLTPTLLARLRTQGWDVAAIRIKVLGRG
jgi:hypothetical protein